MAMRSTFNPPHAMPVPRTPPFDGAMREWKPPTPVDDLGFGDMRCHTPGHSADRDCRTPTLIPRTFTACGGTPPWAGASTNSPLMAHASITTTAFDHSLAAHPISAPGPNSANDLTACDPDFLYAAPEPPAFGVKLCLSSSSALRVQARNLRTPVSMWSPSPVGHGHNTPPPLPPTAPSTGNTEPPTRPRGMPSRHNPGCISGEDITRLSPLDTVQRVSSGSGSGATARVPSIPIPALSPAEGPSPVEFTVAGSGCSNSASPLPLYGGVNFYGGTTPTARSGGALHPNGGQSRAIFGGHLRSSDPSAPSSELPSFANLEYSNRHLRPMSNTFGSLHTPTVHTPNAGSRMVSPKPQGHTQMPAACPRPAPPSPAKAHHRPPSARTDYSSSRDTPTSPTRTPRAHHHHDGDADPSSVSRVNSHHRHVSPHPVANRNPFSPFRTVSTASEGCATSVADYCHSQPVGHLGPFCETADNSRQVSPRTADGNSPRGLLRHLGSGRNLQPPLYPSAVASRNRSLNDSVLHSNSNSDRPGSPSAAGHPSRHSHSHGHGPAAGPVSSHAAVMLYEQLVPVNSQFCSRDSSPRHWNDSSLMDDGSSNSGAPSRDPLAVQRIQSARLCRGAFPTAINSGSSSLRSPSNAHRHPSAPPSTGLFSDPFAARPQTAGPDFYRPPTHHHDHSPLQRPRNTSLIGIAAADEHHHHHDFFTRGPEASSPNRGGFPLTSLLSSTMRFGGSPTGARAIMSSPSSTPSHLNNTHRDALDAASDQWTDAGSLSATCKMQRDVLSSGGQSPPAASSPLSSAPRTHPCNRSLFDATPRYGSPAQQVGTNPHRCAEGLPAGHSHRHKPPACVSMPPLSDDGAEDCASCSDHEEDDDDNIIHTTPELTSYRERRVPAHSVVVPSRSLSERDHDLCVVSPPDATEASDAPLIEGVHSDCLADDTQDDDDDFSVDRESSASSIGSDDALRERLQLEHYVPWLNRWRCVPVHVDVNGTTWMATAMVDGLPYAVKEVFCPPPVEAPVAAVAASSIVERPMRIDTSSPLHDGPTSLEHTPNKGPRPLIGFCTVASASLGTPDRPSACQTSLSRSLCSHPPGGAGASPTAPVPAALRAEIAALTIANRPLTAAGWAACRYIPRYYSVFQATSGAYLVQTEYFPKGCLVDVWLPRRDDSPPRVRDAAACNPNDDTIMVFDADTSAGNKSPDASCIGGGLFAPQPLDLSDELTIAAPPQPSSALQTSALSTRSTDTAGAFLPSPLEVLRCLHHALCALDALHASGFVHGNPTPYNVFVASERHYKLGGLGACTRVGQSAAPHAHTPAPYLPSVSAAAATDGRCVDVFVLGASMAHQLVRCIERLHNRDDSWAGTLPGTKRDGRTAAGLVERLRATLCPPFAAVLDVLAMLTDADDPPHLPIVTAQLLRILSAPDPEAAAATSLHARTPTAAEVIFPRGLLELAVLEQRLLLQLSTAGDEAVLLHSLQQLEVQSKRLGRKTQRSSSLATSDGGSTPISRVLSDHNAFTCGAMLFGHSSRPSASPSAANSLSQSPSVGPRRPPLELSPTGRIARSPPCAKERRTELAAAAANAQGSFSMQSYGPTSTSMCIPTPPLGPYVSSVNASFSLPCGGGAHTPGGSHSFPSLTPLAASFAPPGGLDSTTGDAGTVILGCTRRSQRSANGLRREHSVLTLRGHVSEATLRSANAVVASARHCTDRTSTFVPFLDELRTALSTAAAYCEGSDPLPLPTVADHPCTHAPRVAAAIAELRNASS